MRKFSGVLSDFMVSSCFFILQHSDRPPRRGHDSTQVLAPCSNRGLGIHIHASRNKGFNLRKVTLISRIPQSNLLLILPQDGVNKPTSTRHPIRKTTSIP
jgi:hypothetical protein